MKSNIINQFKSIERGILIEIDGVKYVKDINIEDKKLCWYEYNGDNSFTDEQMTEKYIESKK